ncbi:hypothetical protein Tco_0468711 [Tanacetum coccineum]
MVEDRIMNSGASFHATYCKKELDRFRLRSGKVCLVDDKILDIAGIGDIFLKTSFGTSWTLKDVRYIPGLNKRLILVGQLDEEGYHVGFRDQQWWFGEAEESFLHNVTKDKETAKTATGVAIVKDVCGEAMKCTFIGSGSNEIRYSFRDTKSYQFIQSRDITFVDSIYGAKSMTYSSSLTKPIKKSQVVLVDIPKNLTENDNIVAEHGLSSEIT